MKRESGSTLRSLALQGLLILLLLIVAENLYLLAILSTTHTHSRAIEAVVLSGRGDGDDQSARSAPSAMARELRATTSALGYRVIGLSVLKAIFFLAGGVYATWKTGAALARIEAGLLSLAEGGGEIAGASEECAAGLAASAGLASSAGLAASKESAAPGNPLAPEGPEELRRVTERLNGLAANLAAARRELVRSSRLSAAGELAAMLAHEIKNPLAGAALAADALESRVTGPEGLEALGEIRESIGRVDGVVRDLLDLTRPTPCESVPIKVAELLDDTVRSTRRFAETRGLRIEISDPGTESVIVGDPAMARQIMVNLLLNALKATPAGGTGTVETGGGPGMVWVRDHGSGYPGGAGPLNADPFVSGFPEGTGLGLAVVSRLAGFLGWSVSVELPTSGGTVFRVSAQDTARCSSTAARRGDLGKDSDR